jgi:hypothetical protein
LLELLLNLFDSLAIDSLELLLLLEVFTVLAAEIFFFEFDLVVGVPNIIPLDDGQTDVITDFICCLFDTKCFSIKGFSFALGVALSNLIGRLDHLALKCLLHSVHQFVLDFNNVYFGFFNWYFNFAHLLSGSIGHSISPW